MEFWYEVGAGLLVSTITAIAGVGFKAGGRDWRPISAQETVPLGVSQSQTATAGGDVTQNQHIKIDNRRNSTTITNTKTTVPADSTDSDWPEYLAKACLTFVVTVLACIGIVLIWQHLMWASIAAMLGLALAAAIRWRQSVRLMGGISRHSIIAASLISISFATIGLLWVAIATTARSGNSIHISQGQFKAAAGTGNVGDRIGACFQAFMELPRIGQLLIIFQAVSILIVYAFLFFALQTLRNWAILDRSDSEEPATTSAESRLERALKTDTRTVLWLIFSAILTIVVAMGFAADGLTWLMQQTPAESIT